MIGAGVGVSAARDRRRTSPIAAARGNNAVSQNQTGRPPRFRAASLATAAALELSASPRPANRGLDKAEGCLTLSLAELPSFEI